MLKNTAEQSERRGYEEFYENFDSPLMRQLRREAYGEDIGQHSWVTSNELKEYVLRLELSRESRLLDLGCGPGGPLAFITALVGCRGIGTDLSPHAIAAGGARAASLGLEKLVTLRQLDLNNPLPFANASFDAVMSLDVLLHLHDRLSVFRDVARALVPQGRFLFTDADVITGSISNEEISLRATHGYTQFVPPGFNEKMLKLAGFQLVDCSDRTASLLKNAAGRFTARLAHAIELCELEGLVRFERQQRYLETVTALSERGAVSRMSYLAQLAM